MSYRERLAYYESKKAQIAATAKTNAEYEARVKALAKRLNL